MPKMMLERLIEIAFWAATCGILSGAEATNASNGKPSAVPIFTRQRLFSIPFYLNPQVRPPQEVLLFVSGDQGQTWSLYQRRRALDQKFDFQAGGDGEFWFAVRTDQDAQPPPSSSSPEKIVVVDTVAPELTMSVDLAPSGSLRGRWRVEDENLDHTTFRLQYQLPDDDQWQPVTVDLPGPEPQRTEYEGSVSWTVLQRQGTIRVRAEVLDRAGNSGEYDQQIPLRAGDQGPQAGISSPAQGASASDAQFSPTETKLPWELTPASSDPRSDAGATERSASELPPWPEAANRFVSDSADPNGDGGAGPPALPQAAAPSTPSDYVFRSDERGVLPTDSVTRPVGVDQLSNREMVLGAGQAASTGQETELRLRPERTLPMTASPRFNLDYEFVDIDARDVARVELWISEDDGRSWTFYGIDPDRSPPFAVEVPREGIYGFRLLIQDQQGHSATPPQAGDLPDLSIGVDWTRPEAKLMGAEFLADFSGRALEIRWEATDRNLGNTPIRLSYAASPQQTWIPITADLPNLGQYRWRPDVDLPERLFLQLEVYDQAGNMTRVQMPEPIVVRETVPQGRIRRLDPVLQ